MNVKQGGTKKTSWKGGLHRKVHTRVWTTNCQAYESLYFFCDGSNGQYVALARHTFIAQYDTPWHHHTSHHSTWHHHRRTAEGWLTQKTLKNPVWHFHAQIEVTSITLPRPNCSPASTLSNLLSNKHTEYERSTCLSSSKPVQTRIKILSSQAKNTNLLNFHIASPKILRRLLGKTPVMLLSRKCTMLTTSKYSNKQQKNRKKGRIAPSLSW